MNDINIKTSHVFWGTLFISVGLLVLINNFTSLLMDWGAIWKLWPLFIVLLGISLLVKHKYGKGLLAGVAAFILAFTMFASFKTIHHFVEDDMQVVWDEHSPGEYTVKNFTEAYDSTIEHAVLNFDAGAGAFFINDTTNELISVEHKGKNSGYSLSRYDEDGTTQINLGMEDAHITFGSNYKNKVNIALHKNPLWDLNFEVGAAKLKMDLTEFAIANIEVDMGAASIDVKLGDNSLNTNVSIEAGASEIKFQVPETSGCEVQTDAVLSSKHIEGFEKINSGLYRTENYNTAEKKILISIDCGVSSIKISRYGVASEVK